MKTILLAFLVSLAAAVAEEPLKLPDFSTLDGKLYKDVTVKSSDALGIKIMHSTGFARLKFDVLPDDLKKRFGYDPVEAKSAEEYDEKRRKNEIAAATDKNARERFKVEARKALTNVQGRVLQVLPDRIILTDAKSLSEDRYLTRLPDSAACIICDTSKIVDGESINDEVYYAGSWSYTAAFGGSRKINCYVKGVEPFIDYLTHR